MLSNEELMNGHPLRVLRTRMDLSQKELAAKVGVSEATIIRAENGHRISPKVRRLLCDRLGMTSEELGLFGKRHEVIYPTPLPQVMQEQIPSSQTTSLQAVSMQPQAQQTTDRQHPPALIIKQQQGTNAHVEQQQEQEWLTLGTSYLGQLFDEGWSIDEILDMSKFLLQTIQEIVPRNRLKLLGASTATSGSNISILTGNATPREEYIQFCSALGKSIDAAWRLLRTAGSSQVLAVGKALLYVIQQNHIFLPFRERNRFYSSVQNLIGKALHFQGRYEEAIEAHVNAHIAALGSGDVSEVVRCLQCQSSVYRTLAQYSQSIQAIEEALRYLNNPRSEMLIRIKALLLASWADNAMNLGDYAIAQQKLAESKVLLDGIKPDEEFDLASWFQFSGNYAYITKDYEVAIQKYEKALVALSSRWLMRQVFILMPLLSAYTCTQNREGILAILGKSVTAVQALNEPIINKYFVETVQGVLVVFENDPQVYGFAIQTLHQFS